MIRRFYAYLVRLHPDWFRRRFGEEMLSIFDESVRDQRRFRLVIDAFVSMLRQRMLRTDYLLHPQLFHLHQRAEHLRKQALKANLTWALATIPLQIAAAVLMNPGTRTVAAELWYAVVPAALFLSLHRIFSRGLDGSAEDYASIANAETPGRIQLERKRDSLLRWAQDMGRVLIVMSLALGSIAVFGGLLGASSVGRSWMRVYLVVFAIQTSLFFLFLRRLNRKAAREIDEEIGAINALAN
jgi:hypothetical protein